MPIPPFNEHGYLPPGIHRATMEEVEERFGRESELRRVELESLGWLVDAARRAGILRIILNGSFVTDALEPNDVDCALLTPLDFPRDSEAWNELNKGFPFVEMHILEGPAFEKLINRTFASDRDHVAKGMLEVIL